MAWWDAESGEAVVASSSSGRELQRVSGPNPGARLNAVGWLGTGDVLFFGEFSETRQGGWRTSGSAADWPVDSLTSASPSGQLVAGRFLARSDTDASCTAMFTAAELDSPLWRHCYWRGDMRYDSSQIQFSPDGRLVLASGGQQTNGSRPYLAVLDARSGAVLTRFDEGRYGTDRVGAMQDVDGFTFEDDDHVLVSVADRAGQRGTWTRNAILRCAVTGGCELATTPVRYNWEREGSPSPYRLAR